MHHSAAVEQPALTRPRYYNAKSQHAESRSGQTDMMTARVTSEPSPSYAVPLLMTVVLLVMQD